jgi:hypothetical protein
MSGALTVVQACAKGRRAHMLTTADDSVRLTVVVRGPAGTDAGATTAAEGTALASAMWYEKVTSADQVQPKKDVDCAHTRALF